MSAETGRCQGKRCVHHSTSSVYLNVTTIKTEVLTQRTRRCILCISSELAAYCHMNTDANTYFTFPHCFGSTNLWHLLSSDQNTKLFFCVCFYVTYNKMETRTCNWILGNIMYMMNNTLFITVSRCCTTQNKTLYDFKLSHYYCI